MKNESDYIRDQIERLQALKGSWGELAQEPGLSYHWVQKYALGTFKNITLAKYCALERALVKFGQPNGLNLDQAA